jgi:hypothetical protein
MCFSAETSFAAGAILAVAGVVLVKKFYNSKTIFLALIPLFFGIQQFAEGIVWEALKYGTYPNAYNLTAQYIFLFFADMFWPVWIPLAFGLVEKVLWRQIMMGALMLIGLLFFFNIGHSFIVYGDVKARILENSIDYGVNPLPYRILYGVITMTPFFLSSIPKMWILGIANTIAFIVADISYNYAFTSVWCGACAIITIGLFILLEEEPAKSTT